jgi:hypothetical protein
MTAAKNCVLLAELPNPPKFVTLIGLLWDNSSIIKIILLKGIS